MHRDTIIGIVGVVILVAAMVGVFTYESGQAAVLGPGTFQLANLTGASIEGSVDVGGEASDVLTLTQTNLTKVAFTLRWGSAQTSENTLQLVVAPANGTGLDTGVESDAETDGEITVEIMVPNAEPTSGPLALGVGDYHVTVRFLSAAVPTAGVSPPGALPVTDSTVTWTLTTALTAYEPASG
jgi:hypothetical protein